MSKYIQRYISMLSYVKNNDKDTYDKNIYNFLYKQYPIANHDFKYITVSLSDNNYIQLIDLLSVWRIPIKFIVNFRHINDNTINEDFNKIHFVYIKYIVIIARCNSYNYNDYKINNVVINNINNFKYPIQLYDIFVDNLFNMLYTTSIKDICIDLKDNTYMYSNNIQNYIIKLLSNKCNNKNKNECNNKNKNEYKNKNKNEYKNKNKNENNKNEYKRKPKGNDIIKCKKFKLIVNKKLSRLSDVFLLNILEALGTLPIDSIILQNNKTINRKIQYYNTGDYTYDDEYDINIAGKLANVLNTNIYLKHLSLINIYTDVKFALQLTTSLYKYNSNSNSDHISNIELYLYRFNFGDYVFQIFEDWLNTNPNICKLSLSKCTIKSTINSGFLLNNKNLSTLFMDTYFYYNTHRGIITNNMIHSGIQVLSLYLIGTTYGTNYTYIDKLVNILNSNILRKLHITIEITTNDIFMEIINNLLPAILNNTRLTYLSIAGDRQYRQTIRTIYSCLKQENNNEKIIKYLYQRATPYSHFNWLNNQDINDTCHKIYLNKTMNLQLLIYKNMTPNDIQFLPHTLAKMLHHQLHEINKNMEI